MFAVKIRRKRVHEISNVPARAFRSRLVLCCALFGLHPRQTIPSAQAFLRRTYLSGPSRQHNAPRCETKQIEVHSTPRRGVGHASTYIARVGEWRVPVLNGIISTPTLRADGSILQTPGYDYESGLLYDPGDAVFDPVPEAPSREEAIQALHILWRPFQDFRFAEPVDKSVLLAAVLTSFIRRSLRTAPLFALDAPTAGSGKTYVAAAIGIMAYGHSPTIISQGKTEEEDEKRIGAVLMAGDGIVVIDNCDRPISGDSLCRKVLNISGKVVPQEGLEPPTLSLRRTCSTS